MTGLRTQPTLVRFLIRYFVTRTLTPSGIYCLIAGIACIIRFA